jgi:hypothetical protein
LNSADLSDSDLSGKLRREQRQNLRPPAAKSRATTAENSSSRLGELTPLPPGSNRQKRRSRGSLSGSDIDADNNLAFWNGTTDRRPNYSDEDDYNTSGPPPLIGRKFESSSDEDSSDDHDVPDLIIPGNADSRYVETSEASEVN